MAVYCSVFTVTSHWTLVFTDTNPLHNAMPCFSNTILNTTSPTTHFSYWFIPYEFSTKFCILSSSTLHTKGRDSSVGIAMGWTVWGSNPGGGGRDFPHPSRPALGPTQPPIQWVPGLPRGQKRPGRGDDHPPLSSVEVEGRVEAFVACFREKFTFTLSLHTRLHIFSKKLGAASKF